jgi:hypothetical protein
MVIPYRAEKARYAAPLRGLNRREQLAEIER